MISVPTDNLCCLRGRRAKVLVVTDAPWAGSWRDGDPMPRAHMEAFGRYAKRFGFTCEDFTFANPCPPVPDRAAGSESRLREFTSGYREEFQALAAREIAASGIRAVALLGKVAGAQATGGACAIAKWRGTFREVLGLPALPLYSVAQILRRVEDQPVFESDFRQLAALRDAGWDLAAATDTAEDYRWCYDLDEFDLLGAGRPALVFADTETTGLARDAEVITVQLCWEPGLAISVPVHPKYAAYRPGTARLLSRQLRELFGDPRTAVVGHHFKFDVPKLRRSLGAEVANWSDDTMQLAFVCDDNMRSKGQADCVRRWVPTHAGYSDEFDKAHDKSRMIEVPPGDMLRYGCGDVDTGLRLFRVLDREARRDRRNYNTYRRVQMPCLRMFEGMEETGVLIDKAALRELAATLGARERELYEELVRHTPPAVLRAHRDAGASFSRDAFTADVLFGRDGFRLKPKVWTDSTKMLDPADRVPSTSGNHHLPYFSDLRVGEGGAPVSKGGGEGYPYIERLLEYSQVSKLLSTYVGEERRETFSGAVPPLKDGSPPKPCKDALVSRYPDHTMEKWGPWWLLRAKLGELGSVCRVVYRGRQVAAFEYPDGGDKEYKRLKRELKKFYRDGVPEDHEWHPLTKARRRLRKPGEPLSPAAYRDRVWEHVVKADGKGGQRSVVLARDGELYYREVSPPTGFWQHLQGGKIHTSFSLSTTVTGRTTSRGPNLQNIPVHGIFAKPYRAVFVAPPGRVFVSADQSQVELRVAAWQFDERNMIRLYRQGADLHSATAAGTIGMALSRFLSLSDEELDELGDPRFKAKAQNFGLLYGQWWKGFMAYARTQFDLELSEREAQEMCDKFFDTYPGLRTGHEATKRFVAEHGYVRALHGALRRLPSVGSDDEKVQRDCARQAVNSPIQRFASDLALVGVQRFARDCDPALARPVLFIHDDNVLDCDEGFAPEAAAALKWYMENPPLQKWFGIRSPVPFVADVKVGRNLRDMEKFETAAAKPAWFTED